MINLFPTWTEEGGMPKISIIGCAQNEYDVTSPINDHVDHCAHFMFQTEDQVIIGWVNDTDEWIPDRIASSYAQGRLDTLLQQAPLPQSDIPDSAQIIPWDDLPDNIKSQFPGPDTANDTTDDDEDDLNTGQYL